MENEGKTHEEVTSPQEEITATTVEVSNPTPEGQPAGQQETVDYTAEIEKLQKKLSQAEFKLTQKNIEEKKKKEVDPYEALEIDEDIIDQKVNEKFGELEKKIFTKDISEEISSISSNPEEQKLIRLIYETKINKSGYDRESIHEDIKLAHLIANKSRLEKIASEMKAKTISDNGKGVTGGSGGQAIKSDTDSGMVALTDEDKRFMQKFGLTEKDIIN